MRGCVDIQRFELGLGEWVIRHRWWIILVSILTVVSAGSGIQFLTFNRDLRVFFSEQDPHLKALENLENTYTKSDNVVFVLAPKNGSVFTQKTLTAIKELTERSWQIPYASRVDSITNYQHTSVDGDALIVENLVQNAEALSDADLTRIRSIALDDPTLINRLISPSGQVTGVFVTILLPGHSIMEVSEVADSARNLAKRVREANPDLRVYLTGTVMIDDAYAEVSQDDLITLGPVMVLILTGIVGFLLRSLMGTLVALLMIVLSVITGMGLAGWLGISLNPASVTAPTIILTVAVADSVHILVSMFQGMRAGASKREAIAESLRLNLQPVFLTSITTTIGFLTMNFSESPPFRDLGNIVAMGLMGALGYSMFLLPAVIAVFPVHVRHWPDTQGVSFNRLADVIINKRKFVFWGVLVALGILLTGITRIELNDDWVQYFDQRYRIRVATDFASNNLFGFYWIEYSLDSGASGGINDPEYMRKVEEFARWYRQQPKVVHVTTIADTVKRMNETLHEGDETYYRIPDKREQVAQYLLLYEMSLPFGLDLNHRINIDKSATRMTVFLRETNTSELRQAEEKAQDWLQTNAANTLSGHGTGLSLIWAHISERNIRAMLGASFAALALISGILIFALRSAKFGFISLVPNLGPAFMAFGIWGYLVGQIGLALSVIVSLTLGIIVDDTVHFMVRYLRARRDKKMNPEDAVRYAFTTVGAALWITSIALVAGFLVLTLSGYRMTSDLGLMAAITISMALVLDFLLLPTLLMKVENMPRKCGE